MNNPNEVNRVDEAVFRVGQRVQINDKRAVDEGRVTNGEIVSITEKNGLYNIILDTGYEVYNYGL